MEFYHKLFKIANEIIVVQNQHDVKDATKNTD